MAAMPCFRNSVIGFRSAATNRRHYSWTGADILKQRSPDMRRDGQARGASEAKLAAVVLGAGTSRAQATAWINGAIDERSDELRRAGSSDKDIEAWDWACRIMFMLKIRHAIVD
jgi:hypothetical protein